MSFTDDLRASKGNLSAREVAGMISEKLSVRTVEDWLADRRTPPEWTHDWIISRLREQKLLEAKKAARIQAGFKVAHYQ